LLLREVEVDRLVDQGGEGNDLGDGALEVADIGVDVLGDELEDVVGKDATMELCLVAEDGDAGLEAGCVEARHEPPLEAGEEALFEAGEFLRRAVAGLLLCGFLRAACQEMDVIDEHGVEAAEDAAEPLRLPMLDGGDKVVHEAFAGQEEHAHLRVIVEQAMGDRLHQVCLAQTNAAVEEEGVVGVAGVLGDGERRGVWQGIGGASTC